MHFYISSIILVTKKLTNPTIIPAMMATPRFLTYKGSYIQLAISIKKPFNTSMNKPRLKMIAGKDKITKTGLSAMLIKAKKNPAPITVPTPVPTLNRSGPSSEAATQSPSPEIIQRMKKCAKKCCICSNCIKGACPYLFSADARKKTGLAWLFYDGEVFC